MTYRPAPETLAQLVASVSHLPSFDHEEFGGFLAISPLLPKSEKAAAWHAKAEGHLEAAEVLAVEAQARMEAGLPEVARALLEGGQIRLAAAQHAGAWVAVTPPCTPSTAARASGADCEIRTGAH